MPKFEFRPPFEIYHQPVNYSTLAVLDNYIKTHRTPEVELYQAWANLQTSLTWPGVTASWRGRNFWGVLASHFPDRVKATKDIQVFEKHGYRTLYQVIDGSRFKCKDFPVHFAETIPEGHYIGDPDTAKFLCVEHGIKPQLKDPTSKVCSIGFSEKQQKWAGWSHRAIGFFGIGDKVNTADHLCSQSGWTPEYLAEHPEKNRSLPVGFTAKTLSDCKRMAIAFADAVA